MYLVSHSQNLVNTFRQECSEKSFVEPSTPDMKFCIFLNLLLVLSTKASKKLEQAERILKSRLEKLMIDSITKMFTLSHESWGDDQDHGLNMDYVFF